MAAGGQQDEIDRIRDKNRSGVANPTVSVSAGDRFPVPSGAGWFECVRGGNHFGDGHACVRKGGEVTVIGSDPEFGILVDYRAPKGSGGTNAVSGSVFFVDAAELVEWPARCERSIQRNSRLYQAVARLMGTP